MLRWLTDGGENVDAWRKLPKLYAAILLATAVLFALTTRNRLPAGSAHKTMLQRLEPLKYVRVWRFGLYYFFVFGGFVGLAQWLVPYYVNAYGTTVALAGALAACNSLPSGVIRALGGWMSDHWARGRSCTGSSACRWSVAWRWRCRRWTFVLRAVGSRPASREPSSG